MYKGRRKCDGKTVAIKVMLARIVVDEQARRLFLREIEVTRRLIHPQIVSLLESGAEGGAFYFVMDYCSGGSLHALARRHGGKLPLSAAAPLMFDCLDALDYAHRAGFVHRDLKPSNILLDERDVFDDRDLFDDRDRRSVAKIADFGLAKCFETAGLSGMTAMGNYGGTWSFMPPEQITDFKFCRPVSDLWSMAATFYYLLTDCLPFDFRDDRDPVAVILDGRPVPLRQRDPAIEPAVARAIDRALAREPDERYQAAAEFKAALMSALGIGAV